jgi:hypothetical protein
MTITITFRDENSGCFKSVDITKEGLIDMITNDPEKIVSIINEMEKKLPQATNRGGGNGKSDSIFPLPFAAIQSFI